MPVAFSSRAEHRGRAADSSFSTPGDVLVHQFDLMHGVEVDTARASRDLVL